MNATALIITTGAAVLVAALVFMVLWFRRRRRQDDAGAVRVDLLYLLAVILAGLGIIYLVRLIW